MLEMFRQLAVYCSASSESRMGTLCAILRHYGRWAYISGRVRMLPQRSDVGRELSQEEEGRILKAIGESRSPALYPFFVLTASSI
jgi:hypothetical protein